MTVIPFNGGNETTETDTTQRSLAVSFNLPADADLATVLASIKEVAEVTSLSYYESAASIAGPSLY